MTMLTTVDVDAPVALARAGARRPVDPVFTARFTQQFPRLHGLFLSLYGDRDDGQEVLSDVIAMASQSWTVRPLDLKIQDARRVADPTWFQSEQMVGGVCYVDRFGGSILGIHDLIPYFRELGLTYLHLMPLFDAPEGENDGGYAVSSYRRVNPSLGTMDQLTHLASDLRNAGISLVLDFIFNHTSNEHEWAKKAIAGDPDFEDFYLIYPDRTIPDEYEKTTREVFPDDHPGSFVQLDDGRWIWSTFHHYQWDLNYANPAVFRAMVGEMLFLANMGVEVLRMDAVAFIWKQLGTSCESLPQAHMLLQAFNAVLAMAAPGMIFKSEAIVHPDEVIAYVSPEECQLSYNPLQMALTWQALATRRPQLLQQALERRHALPAGTAWVNYVRSHDDIGWTFADEDAAELGINGTEHRRFLNAFYVGETPGSFARGVAFQKNPKTGDARVAGTTASLAGVEAGANGGVERILLAHALAMSTGGIPLLYLGDEVAQLNDYTYADDPARRSDSRWVHRGNRARDQYARRSDRNTPAGQIFAQMTKLISIRKRTPAFAGNELVGFNAGSRSVLGFQRPASDGTVVLVLANFGETETTVTAKTMSGFGELYDLVAGAAVNPSDGIGLGPHGFVWLRARPIAAASSTD